MSVYLAPSNPSGPLRVTVFARSSAADRAGEKAITSSFQSLKEAIRSIYDWPIEFLDLGVEGRGMEADWLVTSRLIDRATSQECDVLVTDELTRLSRSRAELEDFLQMCIDAGVRVICTEDGFDSADSSTWRFS